MENVGPDMTAEFESASTGITFSTLDEAFMWGKELAVNKGFDIVKSSKKKRYMTCDHYFSCDCASGKKKKKDIVGIVRKFRQTASKKIGCEFRGVVRKGTDGEFHISITYGRHNHAMAHYKEGHSNRTRLNDADKTKIVELMKAQCKPKVIVAALKNGDKDSAYVKKAVSNFIHKARKQKSSGRNPAREFLHLATKNNYFTRVLPEPNSTKLRGLFWSHPDGRSMLRTFPNVVCVDATYSTNRYHCALVEFIGVTPTNQNFTAAQALLRVEDKASYLWIFQRFAELLGYGVYPTAIVTDRELALFQPIRDVFPYTHHILCLFHIRKMMKTRVLTLVHNEKEANKIVWGAVNKMIESSTIEEFYVKEMEWRNSDSWMPEFVQYMDETWMAHREKFVKAWTNNVMHYGNTTTNRVEGAHSSLKTWIRSAQGGLDTLFYQVHAEVEGQVSEVKMMLEWSRTKVLDGFDVAPYMFLLLKASHHCLKLLKNEYTKTGMCNHSFSTTHGLPCKCYLSYMGNEGYILPSCINRFWITLRYGDGYGDEQMPRVSNLYDIRQMMSELEDRDVADQIRIGHVLRSEMYPENCPYQEPSVKESKRGRPSKKKGKSTRLSSGWEHAEQRYRKKTSKGCKGSSTNGKDSNVEKTVHSAVKNVPPYMRHYLRSVVDVKSDGNCGFRCAALRFYGSEAEYRTVRQNMCNEITSNRNAYLRIYHTDEELDVALHRINWSGGSCYEDKWMVTPCDLFAMAQVFRAVVSTYLYSAEGNVHGGSTVFPWRGEIAEYEVLPEISIIHMHEEEHYVLGYFGDGESGVHDHPLSGLHPLWRYMRTRSLRGLEDQYGERLNRYLELQQAFRRQGSGKRRI